MEDLGIIAPPENCSCGRPASVNQIQVVRSQTGQVLTGAFSEFGNVMGKALVLKTQYRFKTWLVKCAPCFYDAQQEEMFG